MLTVVAASAPAPAPDLIAQIHFAGAGQISADTNAVAFTNLWCSPEAEALREQTLNKLSHAPYRWLKSRIFSSTDDEAGLIKPLLDDLLSAEWFLQMRDTTNGSPELALAIRLDAGRARLWQTNLENILETWTTLSAEKNRDGWELQKHRPPNLIRFVRAGDWIVFGWGQDKLPLNDELVRHAQTEKRPAPVEQDWLTADLDWPRLARWYPALSAIDLPETQWHFAGCAGNLHLDGRLIFPQPLALNLEPWRMPTNTIHQPFISLTAVRGIAPWLAKQSRTQPYEISPAPNQMFIWALAGLPLQTFAALPAPDGAAALKELEQKLTATTNWQNNFILPITMNATSNQIAWSGLPFVAPRLEAVHEPSGDFLFASVSPNSPRSKPLPPALLAQFARSNLVYYHWEITAERLRLLPQLSQLALMFTDRRQLDIQSAAGQWLNRVGPTLGSSLTEVTQTAPNELSFTRTAPGGLTAVELTALANWLEAPNFPGCDLRLPPPNRRRSHAKTPVSAAAQTNTPSPAAQTNAPSPAVPAPPH